MTVYKARKANLPYNRWVLAGVFLFILGLLLLLILGFTVVRSYFDKFQGYEETMCSVTRGNLTRLMECECTDASTMLVKSPTTSEMVEKPCTSTLPCVQIMVTYTAGKKGQVTNAIYYENADAMERSKALSCSYYTCYKDHKTNDYSARLFLKDRGFKWNTVPCYYQADKTHQVLGNVVTKAQVAHAIIWPLLISAFGLFLALFCKEHKISIHLKKSCIRPDTKSVCSTPRLSQHGTIRSTSAPAPPEDEDYYPMNGPRKSKRSFSFIDEEKEVERYADQIV